MSAALNKTVELVIMQGPAGSGKTKYARSLSDAVVCSTADFFIDNGSVYRFDAKKLLEAHIHCQARAYEALKKREYSRVVVDSTNIYRWCVIPYIRMAIQLNIKVLFKRMDDGEFKNANGVKSRGDINDMCSVKQTRAPMEDLSISSILSATEPDFIIEANKIGPTVMDVIQAKQMMIAAGYPIFGMPKPVWPNHNVPFKTNGFCHYVADDKKRYVCYLPEQSIFKHRHDTKEEFIVTSGAATVGINGTTSDEPKYDLYGPGSTIQIQANVVHWLRASSSGCCFYETMDTSTTRKTEFI